MTVPVGKRSKGLTPFKICNKIGTDGDVYSWPFIVNAVNSAFIPILRVSERSGVPERSWGVVID